MSKQVPLSVTQLGKALSVVGEGAVLVGGQALMMWAAIYDIKPETDDGSVVVTSDADFLGNKTHVENLARKMHGTPMYPPKYGISALTGTVRIDVGPDEHIIIDVIHSIVGLASDEVRKRAFSGGSTDCLVMHPVDVLQSRVSNISKLTEKRTPESLGQAKLALRVVAAYIEGTARDQDPDIAKLAMDAAERVTAIAKSSAGKVVAKEYGLSFLSAVPAHAIKNEQFHEHRWPRMQDELNRYAADTTASEFAAPAAARRPKV